MWSQTVLHISPKENSKDSVQAKKKNLKLTTPWYHVVLLGLLLMTVSYILFKCKSSLRRAARLSQNMLSWSNEVQLYSVQKV